MHHVPPGICVQVRVQVSVGKIDRIDINPRHTNTSAACAGREMGTDAFCGLGFAGPAELDQEENPKTEGIVKQPESSHAETPNTTGKKVTDRVGGWPFFARRVAMRAMCLIRSSLRFPCAGPVRSR